MSLRHEAEPPPFHRRELLFESLGIAAVDFRCRAHVEPEGPEEPNQTHSIVFVRRGAFRRFRGRETLLADPNQVLLFNAGEPYRYSHPLVGGDDCTILTVEPARALELVARFEPRDAERPEAPFRPGHALRSRRAARLHLELAESSGDRACSARGGKEVDAAVRGLCLDVAQHSHNLDVPVGAGGRRCSRRPRTARSRSHPNS